MAPADRPAATDLVARLQQEPHAFDFYAAVRSLQALHTSCQRVGYSGRPAGDPVRFAQSPAMDFAPSTVEAVRQTDPLRPPVFFSRHFGLFGPHGPLPLCLTEYARDRSQHHGDPTFAAFCNIFHHRLTSFFFRVWADAQKTVDFDRPDEERWSHYVGSLIGLGMDSLHRRDSLPDYAKLYYAGRFVQQNRNADGLAAVIEDFFDVATEVQPFVGRWLKLNGDGRDARQNYLCQLGGSSATGRLGSNLIVGSTFWTCQIHFRLQLGPMKLQQLESFLPTGSSFKRLQDWVRNYAGDELTWDARMILEKAEVPQVRLGQNGQLGWTSWLKTKPFQDHADNLILNPPDQS